MSLFDELTNGVLKNLMSSADKNNSGDKMSSLLNMAIGMSTKNGLDGFLKKLSDSGLKDQVKSWVSTDKNKSVSPDQLTKALGPKIIDEMTKKSGMDKGNLTKSLASMLPEVINKLTPNGEVNDNEVQKQTKGLDFGDLGGMLDKFLK